MRKLAAFDNEAGTIPDYEYERNPGKSFEKDVEWRSMRKLAAFDNDAGTIPDYEYERNPGKSFKRDVAGIRNYEYDLLGKVYSIVLCHPICTRVCSDRKLFFITSEIIML